MFSVSVIWNFAYKKVTSINTSGNMSKFVWLTFVLHFPLSTWTHRYLFKRLHEIRSYTLKEHEIVSLTRQNLIFPLVTGIIWFNFGFRLNIFASKISNFIIYYLWEPRVAANPDIQSNLSVADILYSGHLVGNRPSHGKTLIEKPPYGGHFYSSHLL